MWKQIMTPQQQKIQAQLDLRAQELDAKETYLNTLDKAYDKVQLDIKVAENVVKVRQNQLDDVVKSVNKTKDSLAELEQQYSAKEQRLAERLQESKNDVLRQNEKVGQLTQSVHKLRTTRDSLDTEIKELIVYKKEQEQLLKDAIQAGNDKLHEAKSDVAKFTDRIDELRLEIVDLEQRKVDIAFDVLQAESSYENTKNALDDEELSLQRNLSDLNKQVDEARIEYQMLIKETDERVKELKQIEISISAKQDAIIEERHELETEKRRWESTKSLYDTV